MYLILAIVILVVAALSGGGYFFYTKKVKQKTVISKEKITANEFINVTNIIDDKLYTNDGKVFKYIKLEPIYMDLLSKREKSNFTKKLTAELSTEEKEFTLTSLSQPVNITPLIEQYENLRNNSSNRIIKNMQKNAMLELSRLAKSGEVTERQFFIHINENNTDDGISELDKRALDLMYKFNDCGIKAEILGETNIYRLCNLVTNPHEFNLENADYETTIPVIEE